MVTSFLLYKIRLHSNNHEDLIMKWSYSYNHILFVTYRTRAHIGSLLQSRCISCQCPHLWPRSYHCWHWARWRHPLVLCSRRNVLALTASFCRQRTVKTTRTCPATSLTASRCTLSTTTGIFTTSSSPSRGHLAWHLRDGLAQSYQNHVDHSLYMLCLKPQNDVHSNNHQLTSWTGRLHYYLLPLKWAHCFVIWLLYWHVQHLAMQFEYSLRTIETKW